jgi:hypothetical protein
MGLCLNFSPLTNFIFKEEKCIVMTKGIAIQTILMLLVGILVVGIIVYMVYRYFVGAPLGEQECRSRVTSWCSSCRVMNFDANGYALGSELGNDAAAGTTGCIDEYGFGQGWASTCDCNGGAAGCARTRQNVIDFCAGYTP